jgi:hypothetical protein
MAQRAAHLADRVMPVVPARQWVLSLPFALRYKMAWDHELALRVLDGVFTIDEKGKLKFHRLGAPSTEDVIAVVKDVEKTCMQDAYPG